MKKFTLVLFAVCALLVASSSASSYWGSIWAGQFSEAGEFHVYTVGSALKIQIIPLFGWKIMESHVEIVTDEGDFPSNNKGNPKVGHFRWSVTTAPTNMPHEYSILFEDIPAVATNNVYIAIHTVMVKLDGFGAIIQEETGWCGPCSHDGWVPGLPLPNNFTKWGGNAWGYYFMFTL